MVARPAFNKDQQPPPIEVEVGDPFVDEFRTYLLIDVNALHEELQRQPALFFKVAEHYESAAEEEDIAKDKLSEVAARVELTIRETADVKELKVTEGLVKAQVRVHKDYLTAVETHNRKRRRARRLNRLVSAFDMRSKMLAKLVDLLGNQNYTDVQVRGSESRFKDNVASVNKQLAAVAREESDASPSRLRERYSKK